MPGYGCWQRGLQGGLCEASELTAGLQVLRATGDVVLEGSSEVNREFLR